MWNILSQRRRSKVAPVLAVVFLGLVGLGLMAAPLAMAASDADVEADGGPLATVKAFHAALQAGDADAAAQVLDKDILIFEGGRVQRSRAEYQGHHLQADLEASRYLTRTFENPRVMISGDLAVVASESRTTGRFRDRDYDLLGTETAVLTRGDDGKWRITHFHWSSRPAKR